MRKRSMRAAMAAAGGLICAALVPTAASATNLSIATSFAGIDGSVGGINGTIHFNAVSENAQIGRIRLIGSDQDGGAISLPVYCIDVLDWLGNGTFTQTTLGALTFSQAQVTNVVKFLSYADPLVTNNVTSAAAQLGVWEILNESSSGWDLAGGNFSVESLWGSNIMDAASLANTWLGSLANGELSAGHNVLTVLDPGPNNQAQAFITAGDPDGEATAPVPEPTTWAMIVMGFGVLGAALRRRKQEDALFA